jgi:hypothetical protein
MMLHLGAGMPDAGQATLDPIVAVVQKIAAGYMTLHVKFHFRSVVTACIKLMIKFGYSDRIIYRPAKLACVYPKMRACPLAPPQYGESLQSVQRCLR